jgi:hypothetical protein
MKTILIISGILLSTTSFAAKLPQNNLMLECSIKKSYIDQNGETKLKDVPVQFSAMGNGPITEYVAVINYPSDSDPQYAVVINPRLSIASSDSEITIMSDKGFTSSLKFKKEVSLEISLPGGEFNDETLTCKEIK